MSNRASSSKYALPANPAWIEFERTDGDQSQWPQNTTKNVDREGHVNYMRVSPVDDPLCIKWRVEVGKALGSLMELAGKFHNCDEPFVSDLISYDLSTEGQDYVLKSWPQGYQMFDHNKGPEGAPRHDAYLMGELCASFTLVPLVTISF